MVDTTDLIILTSVVQTVVISLTLVVFIFQFRSQEKAIKESAVQNVMGRYTNLVQMLVDKPELRRLLNQPQEKLTQEEETVSAFILVGYGLFEEIYGLYKKKWIDEESWKQWSNFLARMAAQPMFRRIHNVTRGTFDSDFQDYVSKLMEEAEKSPEVRAS